MKDLGGATIRRARGDPPDGGWWRAERATMRTQLNANKVPELRNVFARCVRKDVSRRSVAIAAELVLQAVAVTERSAAAEFFRRWPKPCGGQ